MLGVAGLVVYEPRRADPLLELRLFRSVPFSAAIVMALFGAVRVRRVPVRHDAVPAGRPRHVGARGRAVPAAGRGADRGAVAAHRPARRQRAGRGCRWWSPGCTLAAGGVASLALTRPRRCRPCWRSTCCSGVCLGTVQPADHQHGGRPGCRARWPGWRPRWPPTGRQTGTTLGVAIAGTIVGSALAGAAGVHRRGAAVWWLVLGLGVGIVVLGLLSTGRWARHRRRAAALFEGLKR